MSSLIPLTVICFQLIRVGAQCCPQVPFASGYCADGTEGTPCCGHGPCNVLCCECDYGCRQPPTPFPTEKPVPHPTSQPTYFPTGNTLNPTPSPTLIPTVYPTSNTLNPTKTPTTHPTSNPTIASVTNKTIYETINKPKTMAKASVVPFGLYILIGAIIVFLCFISCIAIYFILKKIKKPASKNVEKDLVELGPKKNENNKENMSNKEEQKEEKVEEKKSEEGNITAEGIVLDANENVLPDEESDMSIHYVETNTNDILNGENEIQNTEITSISQLFEEINQKYNKQILAVKLAIELEKTYDLCDFKICFASLDIAIDNFGDKFTNLQRAYILNYIKNNVNNTVSNNGTTDYYEYNDAVINAICN